MTNKEKDLCNTCTHMWMDFPLPLDHVIAHCDVADRVSGFKPLDEIVSYPCVKCPYNSYNAKKN